MNELRRRVLRSAAAGIENAYVFTSGRLNDAGETETVTTLAYVDEAAGVAADWEPRYGPICVWHRCAADVPNARPHYIFDYVNDGPLNWTQLAVERCHCARGAPRRRFCVHLLRAGGLLRVAAGMSSGGGGAAALGLPVCARRAR